MELKVSKYGQKWGIDLVTPTGIELLSSTCCYAHKRSAVRAARRIARSKLKVVVEE